MPDTIASVPEPVELVLFDLGGVLMEVGGIGAMRELTGMGSDEDVWRRWLTCRWVRRFESGGCSEAEFAAGLIADWQLDLSAAAFLDAFRAWPTGPLPGAEELVAQTRARVSTGCFSNMSSLHWHGHVAAWPLAGLFDHQFISFELGLLKPDVAAFAHVADRLKLPAGRILFLDDNILNVEGATAAGFQAVRAVGVDQARQRLVEAGLPIARGGRLGTGRPAG